MRHASALDSLGGFHPASSPLRSFAIGLTVFRLLIHKASKPLKGDTSTGCPLLTVPTWEVADMAGRGPRPKDPNRRARTDSSGIASTVLRFEQASAPDLPEDIPWPDHTRRWWAMWAKSPQSDLFGPTDWDFLLDTALIHADVWSGNLDRMPELRLRVAKFGATPEDRARLRMQFADADAAESKRPAAESATARYGRRRLATVESIEKAKRQSAG